MVRRFPDHFERLERDAKRLREDFERDTYVFRLRSRVDLTRHFLTYENGLQLERTYAEYVKVALNPRYAMSEVIQVEFDRMRRRMARFTRTMLKFCEKNMRVFRRHPNLCFVMLDAIDNMELAGLPYELGPKLGRELVLAKLRGREDDSDIQPD